MTASTANNMAGFVSLLTDGDIMDTKPFGFSHPGSLRNGIAELVEDWTGLPTTLGSERLDVAIDALTDMIERQYLAGEQEGMDIIDVNGHLHLEIDFVE